jgi:5-methylcytosine-specific restriction endonuclease McrA
MIISHVKDVVKGKAKLFSRRSSKWPSLRKSFLETHGSCAACGCTEHLEVHHIEPFHENPSLELDSNNLITLCDKPGKDNCHLEIGHLGSFKKKNPNVREEASKAFIEKTKE